MQTPLYERHRAVGARMGPFAGWEMPIQYSGILTEHDYTRTNASLFDTCHMGEFIFSGPSAEADLETLVTQRISTLQAGQCRYGYLLQEDGGVIDDVTVFRRDSDCFFMVVNAGTREGDATWIQAHLSPATVFRDLSPERAKLDVQGPKSRGAVEDALNEELPLLRYFRFADIELDGIPCTVSRTGYTGEFGYELYFPIGETERLWERLLAPGFIRPAGLGARDTLRLEVGYPLYGHELSRDRTPVGVCRGMFIDLDKQFVGCEGIRRDMTAGVSNYLVGLRLASRRAAREGDTISYRGVMVGTVTSGSLAPSLEVAVAMGLVQESACEPGTELQVDVRGTSLPATVVELPFYKEGSARR